MALPDNEDEDEEARVVPFFHPPPDQAAGRGEPDDGEPEYGGQEPVAAPQAVWIPADTAWLEQLLKWVPT